LESKRRPIRLARLAVSLDGKQIPELVLNDVLVAHQSPAATTRYILEAGGYSEEHRSSGIWVSTAAGSTAAIKSAGGRRLPLRSRRFQYVVRELYREPGRDYRLLRGILGPDEEVTLAAKMPEGRIFVDGSRTFYRFPYGMRAQVCISDQPLSIFVHQSKKG
jgi:NAD+ kinase